MTAPIGTPINESPFISSGSYFKTKPFATFAEDDTDLSECETNTNSFSVPNAFDIEVMFTMIKKASESLKVTTRIGESYLLDNRYADVFPYDQNLFTSPNLPSGFYYNASPIEMGGVRYIAAQGSKRGCEQKFWELVFAAGAEVIITTTNTVENNQEKCSPFWEVEQLPDELSVQFEEELDQRDNQRVVIRSFWHKGKEKEITQFQYLGWPDRGVPNIELLSTMISVIDKYRNNKAPIIVNCSAGCGRTGVTIACHSLAHHLQSKPHTVNIIDWVHQMRRQRMEMVQKKGQLEVIYHFVAQKLGVNAESDSESDSNVFSCEVAEE